ncbi:hypothetical protein [Rhodococcus sp. ACS1]|uniref:hypothetical protein n=1 Tax=Rhodococcus sp. ACS1 TaxID=2028570 RepID=UPI0015C934EF|nr:hypothetical protein [Rhodococcus sp. ACS1]
MPNRGSPYGSAGDSPAETFGEVGMQRIRHDGHVGCTRITVLTHARPHVPHG